MSRLSVPFWLSVLASAVPAVCAGCTVPHRAVGCVSTCGNSVLENCEECDDGNTTPGDGCDDLCQREPLVRELSVDPAEVVILGPEAGAHIGGPGRVAVADFNADGIDDIAVGAPELGAGAGEAFLIFGSPSLPALVDLADPSESVRFTGSAPGDGIGSNVVLARVDADATFDLLLSAPGADAPGIDAGAAVLLLGNQPVTAGMTVVATDPRIVLMTGPVGGAGLGASITVGDVRRDSVSEVYLAGVDSTGLGTVYSFPASILTPGSVVDAGDPAVSASAPQGGEAGSAMVVGDVNGDATADLMVGAPLGAGAGGEQPGLVFTLFGAPNLPLGVLPDLAVIGIGDGDAFGRALLVADLDGDGDGDLVVGAVAADGPDDSREDAGGVVFLDGGEDFPASSLALSAADPGLVIHGIGAADRMGVDLAAGDLDNDGVADLVIGAPDGDGPTGAMSGAGEVYVLFGHPGFSRGLARDLADDPADVTVYGAAGDDGFGSSVAVGDVNGDGAPDLVIGTPRFDASGGTRADAGAVLVVLGG